MAEGVEEQVAPSDSADGRLFLVVRDALLFVAPASGQVIRCNPAAEALFQVARPSLVGQALQHLFVEESWASVQSLVEGAASGQPSGTPGASAVVEAVVRRATGEEVPVEVAVEEMDDLSSGRAALVMLRDVSVRKEAEEAQQRMHQEAQQAMHLRDEFLAVASHDLKTPLTGIRAYAQLLLSAMRRPEGPNAPMAERALQTIDEQSEKLNRLITRLLDVSRIQAGRLALDREVSDLMPLVQRVLEAVQTSAPRHTLALQGPDWLQAWVDPLRLEQVLTNLLDNAVRYSPHGCQVDVLVQQVDAVTVQIEVRDHGPGIPEDKRAHLFERFYQAHERGPRNGGMGLGLYIVREIVHLHNGDVAMDVPEDGGARFVVTLPVGLGSMAEGAPAEAVSEPAVVRRATA